MSLTVLWESFTCAECGWKPTQVTLGQPEIREHLRTHDSELTDDDIGGALRRSLESRLASDREKLAWIKQRCEDYIDGDSDSHYDGCFSSIVGVIDGDPNCLALMRGDLTLRAAYDARQQAKADAMSHDEALLRSVQANLEQAAETLHGEPLPPKGRRAGDPANLVRHGYCELRQRIQDARQTVDVLLSTEEPSDPHEK